MGWFNGAKDELDPTFTYITLTEDEVQRILCRAVFHELGWTGGMLMRPVRFDFGNNTVTVGIKNAPIPATEDVDAPTSERP